QSDSAGLQERAEQLNTQLKALTDQKTAREAMALSIVESREQQADLKARNAELKRKMSDLKARINTLSDIGAVCPTCGRELADHDRSHILAEWNDQGHVMGDEFRAAEEKLKELNTLRAALESQIANTDKGLAQETALHRELANIEDRIKRSQEAGAKLPDAESVVAHFVLMLSNEQYAEDARKSLAEVAHELEILGYDGKAHRLLRDVQLPQLKPYEDRKMKLDRAEIGITAEQRALEAITLRESALAERQLLELNERTRLVNEIEACEAVLKHAPEVEAKANAARLELYAAQRKVGEANQRVQSCHALEVKRARLNEELTGCIVNQGILAELRAAFGRNGVPAMVIDSILPQLENSANRLLGRMTNGRMSVRFETQRQTVKGEISETLDLRISDELGERPYEMFSGGEAFRINFAVRVALSQLLAYRANARLQTLFIDEGFGTQDAAGRERLVEAIRSIQDDFELIVAITHFDELKDAFPARIDVTKTPEAGSRAQIA
ncbi:MAG TPA: SbcC/MukB-like Walker B domain-containing protein, partial [Anaerolineae bacterium]